MSLLSKLNLLGLICLSDVVLTVKLSQDLSEAIMMIDQAVKELAVWNDQKMQESGQSVDQIGIASQNIMEDYYARLCRAHEAETTMQELEEIIDANPGTTQEQECRESLRNLELIKKADHVIASKDFMLVFFITCFLPFVRPAIPHLKPLELKAAKKHQRAIARQFRSPLQLEHEEHTPYDFDYYVQCKETMKQLYTNKSELGFNEKSMFLKMHQDLVKRKEDRDAVFNQTLAVASEVRVGNIFWEQLPTNTTARGPRRKPAKRRRQKMLAHSMCYNLPLTRPGLGYGAEARNASALAEGSPTGQASPGKDGSADAGRNGSQD